MKNKLILVLPLVLLGAGLFYWFQIRPSEIRAYCNWEAEGKIWVTSKYYNDYYNSCLHRKGLK